ncbi:MAG: hypothetical protein IBX64_02345 [Actinobacteria bacterium]|nr:hypothetical protein [Actinomycetota bacterium]
MKMRAIIAFLAFLIVLTLPFLVSAGSGNILQSVQAPEIELPDPELGECVEDVSYMRANHMVLLKEERERAVRHGERGDYSLSNCFSCHTNITTFCKRCHDYAGVKPGCFEIEEGCHYAPTSND